MSCFVCLEEGGLRDACPCAAPVHVSCLAQFLERGFRPRCPVCLAAFTPAARLEATELLFRQDPSTANLLSLASIDTIAGYPLRALELMGRAAGAVEPVFRIPYNLEADLLFAYGAGSAGDWGPLHRRASKAERSPRYVPSPRQVHPQFRCSHIPRRFPWRGILQR